MTTLQSPSAKGFAGSEFVLMGDINAIAAVSDISAIEMIVEDEAFPGTAIASSPYTLTPATVLFDEGQTDAGVWIPTETSPTYNFRTETTAEMTTPGPTTGVTRYRFEVWFTPASGNKFVQVFFCDAQESRGPT